MARIEFATTNSDLYCGTSDVARFFEQYSDFDSNTNPTGSDVEEIIFEWMEYIDRQTGHAWRLNTVVEEMKDLEGPYYWWSGVPVGLSKRDVSDLDSSSGDKLEYWDGSSWNDWLTDSSKTSGRGNDFWLDNTNGILYIRDRFVLRRHPLLRLTYRYGNPNGATKAIQQAAAKLTAADLMASDQYSMNVPGTEGGINPSEAAQQWKEDAERIIDERRNVEYIEPY